MNKDFSWDYNSSYEWMSRVNKMDPLIITVAANGGIQGKEVNEGIPEEPDEIAQSTYDAYNAGAGAVHIHGRDPNCLYNCTGDYEVYLEINSKVRAKCPDILINNTTGGGPTTTMEQRYRCLDAMPELASLNMGPDMSKYVIASRPSPHKHPHDGFTYDECIPFSYGIIEKLAREMKKRGIKPEMEIYQPGQYWVSEDLIKQGLVEPPYYFQFVMGAQTSIYPTPANLIKMVQELPKGSIFSTIGIGKFQWALCTLSIILGGHVRIGLEDNIYLKRGVKLKSNAEAVERIVRIARELGREIATPAQAREILGLSSQPSKY